MPKGKGLDHRPTRQNQPNKIASHWPFGNEGFHPAQSEGGKKARDRPAEKDLVGFKRGKRDGENEKSLESRPSEGRPQESRRFPSGTDGGIKANQDQD